VYPISAAEFSSIKLLLPQHVFEDSIAFSTISLHTSFTFASVILLSLSRFTNCDQLQPFIPNPDTCVYFLLRRLVCRPGLLNSKAMGRQPPTVTPASLSVALENQTSSSGTVFAYITGLAIDNGDRLFFLQSDGKTAYYPTQPPMDLSPLTADCGIALDAPNSKPRIVTIPRLRSGRIFFCVGSPLTFLLNKSEDPSPGLVTPSVTNPDDLNYKKNWSFCEFTFDDINLFINITYVDFVSSAPIALTVLNTSGGTQHVPGMPGNGLDLVCSGLVAQNAKDQAGWDRLIVEIKENNTAKIIRALSPDKAIVMNRSLFSGYYDSYVDQVWSKYTGSKLNVETGTWGSFSGDVSNGLLTFPGSGAEFFKPSAASIFSGSDSPFTKDNGLIGAISARLAAAFNRSTLLINDFQPENEVVSTYYQNAITNHYSRIVHAVNIDGRGYGFSYDDVRPTGGADQIGSIVEVNPALLTVTVSGVDPRSV
jgi:hypothetical protein